MLSSTFDEFKVQALAEGFDEVLERSWPADAVLDSHTHPFAEMWLTVGADTRHLNAGDGFEVEREVTHAERYGNTGATYWVARRN